MKNFISLDKPLAAALLAALFITHYAMRSEAQTGGVAIGDTIGAPHPSAILDLSSGSKGLLVPRLSTQQRDSIASPADGLIIYDTDLDRLMYYRSSWNDFGLWATRDSMSGNIYYNDGKIGIGPGMDTLPMPGSLNIQGDAGIVSFVTTTGTVANSLAAELNTSSGTGGNLMVQTMQTGNADVMTMGVYSYLESNATFSVALGSQAFYTGSGGSPDSLALIGIAADAYVMDSSVIMLAIGTHSTAESDHLGINVGVHATAMSDSTFINSGLVATVNNAGGEAALEIISDTFETRFTAAGIFRNFYDGNYDYNIYGAGTAMNYLGGKLGIGAITPDTELHVIGSIKQSITTSNVSNPPTDTELDGLFTSPATKGDGWTTYVKDSDSDNLYQIMVVGTAWYIVGTTKAQ